MTLQIMPKIYDCFLPWHTGVQLEFSEQQHLCAGMPCYVYIATDRLEDKKMNTLTQDNN